MHLLPSRQQSRWPQAWQSPSPEGNHPPCCGLCQPDRQGQQPAFAPPLPSPCPLLICSAILPMARMSPRSHCKAGAELHGSQHLVPGPCLWPTLVLLCCPQGLCGLQAGVHPVVGASRPAGCGSDAQHPSRPTDSTFTAWSRTPHWRSGGESGIGAGHLTPAVCLLQRGDGRKAESAPATPPGSRPWRWSAGWSASRQLGPILRALGGRRAPAGALGRPWGR